MPFLDCRERPSVQKRSGTKSSSALFQKLPPEIRRTILMEAFGNRTVHVYLGLNHPLFLATSNHGTSKMGPAHHGGAAVPLQEWADKPRTENRDTAKPVAWQWWSCVCHGRDAGRKLFTQLHQDFCLNGRRGCYCALWPGEPPSNCQVGALGWLQSCSQAYVLSTHSLTLCVRLACADWCTSGRYGEGLQVLYSTNSFFIDGGAFFHILLGQHESPEHSLIPQSNLKMITSFESRWSFKLFSLVPAVQEDARKSLREYTRLLPRAFPSLTKLYISFRDPIYSRNTPPTDVMDEIDNELLGPLSRVLTEAVCLREYTVALPQNLFDPLSAKNREAGGKLIIGKAIIDRKFWQPVIRDDMDGRGFWIAWGEQSNLYFDAQGKPNLMSHRAYVLH